MLIEEVRLRFGADQGAEPLVLDKPAVTIFVGPNNSGKSLVLREIANLSRHGNRHCAILDGLKFRENTSDEVDEILQAWTDNERRPGDEIYPGYVYLKSGAWREHVYVESFQKALQYPNEYIDVFARNYAGHHVLVLDGPSRIGLVADQEWGDLKDPQSTFAKILTDDPRRQSLRKVLLEAFDLYLGMDISEGGAIKLRYGNTEPPNERSVEDATLEWMRNARPIDQWSDGMKAFTGMLLVLRAGDPKIMIIDC